MGGEVSAISAGSFTFIGSLFTKPQVSFITKIKFLFIKNDDLKNFSFIKSLYGNNFLLFSDKYLNNKDLIDYKNDYNLDIFLKNNYNFLNSDINDFLNISYFLNFNLFISNIVDIYKILIILNLNNINKN